MDRKKRWEKYLYTDELKEIGPTCGGSLIYSGCTPSVGKGARGGSLKLGYSYSSLPSFKMNNYFFQGRVYSLNLENKSLFFIGLELGLSIKTDGRNSYYGFLEMGFNVFKINEAYGKYRETANKNNIWKKP
jgi:hypothetical protein